MKSNKREEDPIVKASLELIARRNEIPVVLLISREEFDEAMNVHFSRKEVKDS